MKGRTVEALLLLDTSWYGSHLGDVMKLLTGRHVADQLGIRDTTRCRLGYVAMTRATSLLCLAVEEQHINGYEEELKASGWQIQHVRHS